MKIIFKLFLQLKNQLSRKQLILTNYLVLQKIHQQPKEVMQQTKQLHQYQHTSSKKYDSNPTFSNELILNKHEKNKNKQNLPLKVNYDKINAERKYQYVQLEDKYRQQKIELPTYRKNNQNQMPAGKQQNQSVEYLKRELEKQKEKNRILEQMTIQEQYSVLNQLTFLEERFSEMSKEKNNIELQMKQMKIKFQSTESKASNENWKEKYEELQNQHKKVKGISSSLINMMKKVDNIEGDTKDAWKWMKKVVWEYQNIRNKAMDWKKVYDEVNKFTEQSEMQPFSYE